MNTKEEFLEKLRASLKGNVEDTVLYSNINYYEMYIDNEVKNGKSEKDVLNELGDPALIAKTIKTVKKINNINTTNNEQSYYYQNSSNESYNNKSNNGKRMFYTNYMGERGSIGCIITMLIVFIIVSIIWKLFFGTIEFAISFFGLPGFLLLLFIWWYFLSNNRR